MFCEVLLRCKLDFSFGGFLKNECDNCRKRVSEGAVIKA